MAQLLNELHAGSLSDAGANELLRSYLHGLDLETLRPSLRSTQDEAAKTATWILAELGDLGSALREELPGLLGHRDQRVRFWAAEAAYFAASHDPSLLELLAGLIGDKDDAVAWKALSLMVSVQDRVLTQGAPDSPLLGAIVASGPEAGAPLLEHAMEHRIAVLRRLRDAMDRAELVGELLVDEDPVVRWLASDFDEQL